MTSSKYAENEEMAETGAEIYTNVEIDPEDEGGAAVEPDSEPDSITIIRISDVLEYLFCPRFIYYMYCLDIPQHEEKRFKVIKGEVFVASKQSHIKGIIDEVLFLEDGTAAPLEYKFAEYKDKIFKTYKFQLVLQALLIRENYGIEVNRAYLCFTRSNSLVKEMEITTSDFKKAEKIIEEILDIVQKGLYPKTSRSSRKCVDCCYQNICV